MRTIPLIVMTSDEAASARIEARLASANGTTVVARIDWSSLASALHQHPGAALLVDLGEKPDDTLSLLEALPEPPERLLVAGPEASPLILRAMRLGAREYLPEDAPSEALGAALERLSGGGAGGTLIAVLGAKGGVGATFVACQLAASLARTGAPTALADVHLRGGDIALYYDVRPAHTLGDLARRSDPPDTAYLATLLHTHPSGVRLLPAPERAEDAELLAVHHVESALALLRAEHRFVVLDLPRGFDEITLRVLDLADELLLVSTFDLPALQHARRDLALLARLGHPASRVRVVANRYVPGRCVVGRDLASFLGQAPEVVLPNDYATASDCVNYGRPLAQAAPRASITRAFSGLAALVHDWRGLPRPPVEEVSAWARARHFLSRRRTTHGAH